MRKLALSGVSGQCQKRVEAKGGDEIIYGEHCHPTSLFALSSFKAYSLFQQAGWSCASNQWFWPRDLRLKIRFGFRRIRHCGYTWARYRI